MGVCPRGAQVGATFSAKEKPNSSSNTISAPCRRAFFYPVPVLAEPGADQVFVALQSARLGFLDTPTQLLHQPADVIRVIVHAKFTLNDLLDTLLRPAVRLKTSFARTA